MVMQLFEPLVGRVDRPEEGHRIRDVNANGQLERGAGLPHRIETAIVDGHESSARTAIPQVEAQRLQHFQPARARRMRRLDLIGLKCRIPGLSRARPPGLGEGEKALRVCAIEADRPCATARVRSRR